MRILSEPGRRWSQWAAAWEGGDRLILIEDVEESDGGIFGGVKLRCDCRAGDVLGLWEALRARFPGLWLIGPEKSGEPYRARFAVRAADGMAFPTPPGAGWEDITLAEVAEGVVEVTVATSAAGAAYVRGEDGAGDWEATAAVGERTRRYALADLGLTTGDGTPSPAGESLLALLRADGQLARPMADRAMLALGEALTAFFGLPDAPLEFARRCWAAKFGGASVVPPSDR